MFDILLRKISEARDYISDSTHWIKGTLDDGLYRYCAVGVINKVTIDVGTGGQSSLLGYVSNAIQVLAAEGKLGSSFFGGDIPTFNDDPRTKHEHVVMVFDKAKEMIAADITAIARQQAEDANVQYTPPEPEPGVYIQMPTKVLEKVG